MNDKLNIKSIEFGIYTYIQNDYAEYFNNRMKVYGGVISYLDSITKKHMDNTTTGDIYLEYVEHCEKNGIDVLKPKSFGKIMNGMCGFETTRTKKQGKMYYYYQEKEG